MGGETSLKSADSDIVVFTVNGTQHSVGSEITPNTSLNSYLRNVLNLRGTKSMCLEGGCGACIVSVTINGTTMSVNSCLISILNCNGWEIETIEGIGNRHDGYHSIQTRLAELNGTQCGYCSPGFVMNMYSLTKDKTATMEEIENSFGGNMCRCTGYRPILEAFKTFASDADAKLMNKLEDIEELYKIPTCPRAGADCCSTRPKNVEKLVNNSTYLHIPMEDGDFYRTTTIAQVFEIFTNHPDAVYILNGGNTAQGVYRITTMPTVFVDINGISELQAITFDDTYLTLGANISMTTAMNTFNEYSSKSGFEYLKHLAAHFDLIGSVPVRNMSSLGGNLMMKHGTRGFTSDLFLLFETAGARIHILDDCTTKSSYAMCDWLDTEMNHKLVYSIVLPALTTDYVFRSYKIMPRAQNSHAHINAGFLFKLDGTGTVLEQPNIIVGGVSESFLHATTTERYLVGKSILDNSVLQAAIKIFDAEVEPVEDPTKYSPAFRKLLAEGLLYKAVLSIKSDELATKLQSGSTILSRDLSSGKHDYETDSTLYPLNEPVSKLEAIAQTAGEAIYVDDVKTMPGEVFCAFVLSTVPNGSIESIDATAALAVKGVIAFYSAADIPGKNLSIIAAAQEVYLPYDEPLFVDSSILYHGQPIGIIVAETNEIARAAVSKVSVVYSGALEKKAIVTVHDGINSTDTSVVSVNTTVTASATGSDTKHVIQGEFSCGSQYHYTMETQSCVCIPCDTTGVIDVWSATQSPDAVHVSVCTVLGLAQNKVNVYLKRMGGAFGAKISRPCQVAASCALASYKLNRPARFVMQMEANFAAIGKRPAVYQKYEAGVDANGKIQYLNLTNWTNAGSSLNEAMSSFTAHHIPNYYDTASWTYTLNEVVSNIPSNTWLRGPGAVDGIAAMENIMEHIARVTGKDAVDVRLQNINSNDTETITELLTELKEQSDYVTRKAEKVTYNEANRWKKRGLGVVLMKYPLQYFGQFNARVSICARDGTVSIIHGGAECGQGINTKVAQVAAYVLGITLDMVSVKPFDSNVIVNNSPTGASVGSESTCCATKIACETLVSRMATVKATLTNPTWKELVFACFSANVALTAEHMFTASDATTYSVHGATIAEVEVDVLTGQHIVRRVDLIEDVGTSMSPEIDLGQIEGGFVLGMGYWTSEDLKYDSETAELLNTRTWNYKPPGVKDIPMDFRVYFRKNSPNPYGVLSSKATGEPSTAMSYSVLLAIRDALDSARTDAGTKDTWYNLDGPATNEAILLKSLTDKTQMVLTM